MPCCRESHCPPVIEVLGGASLVGAVWVSITAARLVDEGINLVNPFT
jgi:hypothetical protein